VTLDPRRPTARAVALGGGVVLGVGSRTDLRHLAGPRTERVDCRGATVLPGLIDPHLHLFALAARHAHLDCASPAIRDIPTLLAAVRATARRLPARAWVRGEGLDESRVGRLPTAAELERAALGHPVRLRHRSRHASVVSEGALRRMRARGWCGPTDDGLVAGREAVLTRIVGPLAGTVLREGLALAGRELASVGLTTVADATPRARRALGPLQEVMDERRFLLRVHAMRPPGTRAWMPASRQLVPGAVKILVEETPRGLRPTPARLARLVRAAALAGSQVAVHCVGAATLVALLAAFAAVPAASRRARRHRLEHVAECPPSLVARIARLGLTVVTNPAFVYWRGDVYRQETDGVARAWLYRAHSLAAAGVCLAGASDAPVVPSNPWLGIAAARTRRTRAGRILTAGERLDAASALALFTRGAAFALGADGLACLRPGAPADIVVVEPDPLRAPADEVADTKVRLTLVGGERAWPA
jgi:predicted amidohydrolase YtcJ